MKYITLSVPDKDYSFFINLMEKLDFVNIEKSAENQKRTRVPKSKLPSNPAKGISKKGKVNELENVAGLPPLKGLGEEAPTDAPEARLFDRLAMLEQEDNWFESLTALTKHCNALLNNEQYVACSDLIDQFLERGFSLRLHLGLLTATNRRKKYIESRARLYDAARELALTLMTPEQTKTALRQLA